jgi:hypothetical protein
MKTDNELIAEFMGAEFIRKHDYFNPNKIQEHWIIKGNAYNQYRDDTKYWYTEPQLRYREDWDWLMPVVKKIRPLWCKNQEEAAANMMAAMFDGDIEITYRYVLEFIKWYSLQLK